MKSIFVLIFSSVLLLSCDHLQLGTPSNSNQIICREGYAIGYNFSRKTVDWIAYRLTPDDFGDVQRQDDFREDSIITKMYQMHKSDYDEPVYDLGHLFSDVPAYVELVT